MLKRVTNLALLASLCVLYSSTAMAKTHEIGDKVDVFGKQWIIVEDNSKYSEEENYLLLLDTSIKDIYFDEPEFSSPINPYNSKYDVSNISAWLNSTTMDWYKPLHGYDAEPTYSKQEPFLYGINDFNKLLKFKDIDSYVALPSLTDIDSKSTEVLSYFKDKTKVNLDNFITNTTRFVSHIWYWDSGYLLSTLPNELIGVRPMILLKKQVEITEPSKDEIPVSNVTYLIDNLRSIETGSVITINNLYELSLYVEQMDKLGLHNTIKVEEGICKLTTLEVPRVQEVVNLEVIEPAEQQEPKSQDKLGLAVLGFLAVLAVALYYFFRYFIAIRG